MAQPFILQPEPQISRVAITEKAAVEHFEHQIESTSFESEEFKLAKAQDVNIQTFPPEDSAGKINEVFRNSERIRTTKVADNFDDHPRHDTGTSENTTVKELPIYTMDEIARHNTIADLWVVVDGDVYNMTEFQHKHPGGYKVMRGVAGKDATKKFDKYHRRAVLVPKKETLLIGTVNENAQLEQTKHKRGFLRRFGFGSSN